MHRPLGRSHWPILLLLFAVACGDPEEPVGTEEPRAPAPMPAGSPDPEDVLSDLLGADPDRFGRLWSERGLERVFRRWAEALLEGIEFLPPARREEIESLAGGPLADLAVAVARAGLLDWLQASLSGCRVEVDRREAGVVIGLEDTTRTWTPIPSLWLVEEGGRWWIQDIDSIEAGFCLSPCLPGRDEIVAGALARAAELAAEGEGYWRRADRAPAFDELCSTLGVGLAPAPRPSRTLELAEAASVRSLEAARLRLLAVRMGEVSEGAYLDLERLFCRVLARPELPHLETGTGRWLDLVDRYVESRNLILQACYRSLGQETLQERLALTPERLTLFGFPVSYPLAMSAALAALRADDVAQAQWHLDRIGPHLQATGGGRRTEHLLLELRVAARRLEAGGLDHRNRRAQLLSARISWREVVDRFDGGADLRDMASVLLAYALLCEGSEHSRVQAADLVDTLSREDPWTDLVRRQLVHRLAAAESGAVHPVADEASIRSWVAARTDRPVVDGFTMPAVDWPFVLGPP